MGGTEPGENVDTPTKKSLFGRLRARSRSLANVHRGERSNTSSPMSKFASGMFGGLFSRKQPTPVTSETKNGALETAPATEDTASSEETTTAGTTSVVATGSGDRFLSASHSNLNTVHTEMDVDAYEGTSKMPSYVNISLAANGYSRSRTNLNNVLSRSGDVHNLIVNGSEVTDLAKDFKAVVFVSDKKNMVGRAEESKKDSTFTLPEYKVEAENVQTFESLTTDLEKQLLRCVELSDEKLMDPNLNDAAKEAVLAASGHTRILLKSKVKKMFQLLEKHQEAGGSETVTVNDLACFWMMLDIEVARIREQFELVEKYRLNDWNPLPEVKADPKPFTTTPSTVKRTAGPKLTPKITPKSDGKTATKLSETPRPRNDMKAFLAQRRKELAEKNGNGSAAGDTVLQ